MQLWHATHSPSLIGLLECLDQQVRRYTHTTLTYPGRWPVVLADYAELLAAIENADAERADALGIRLKMSAEDPRMLWGESAPWLRPLQDPPAPMFLHTPSQQ